MIDLNYDRIIKDNGVVTTVGNFDGVHIGHQKLIQATLKKATEKNTLSMLLTFLPHPSVVLGGETKLITTEDEKRMLIKLAGIDCYIQWPFNEAFANISPESFVTDILYKNLQAKVIMVGNDFRFAKDQGGNMEILRAICEQLHIECVAVEPIMVDESIIDGEPVKVSSNLIRKFIEAGDLETANKLLGYKFFITGKGELVNTELIMAYPADKVDIKADISYKGSLFLYDDLMLQEHKVSAPITFTRKGDKLIIIPANRNALEEIGNSPSHWLIRSEY